MRVRFFGVLPRPGLLFSVFLCATILGTFAWRSHLRGAPTELETYGLGTIIRITATGSKEALGDTAKLIASIDAAMSAHSESSEVGAVNRGARANVSRETLAVIKTGLEVGRASGGAFDISVGPLVSLWDIGGEHPRVPTPDDIRAALKLVDYRDVIISGDTVRMKRPGQAIDLGGVAKGYASDAAAALLMSRGIKSALLDFGGNIWAIGVRPDGGEWNVGVQHPRKSRGVPMASIPVKNGAVVTSGTYERYFEKDGKRYHHILDPRTGYPAEGLYSVTVCAPSGALADALSTALFVLGPKSAEALLAKYPEADALFITEDMRALATKRMFFKLRLMDTNFQVRILGEGK